MHAHEPSGEMSRAIWSQGSLCSLSTMEIRPSRRRRWPPIFLNLAQSKRPSDRTRSRPLRLAPSKRTGILAARFLSERQDGFDRLRPFLQSPAAGARSSFTRDACAATMRARSCSRSSTPTIPSPSSAADAGDRGTRALQRVSCSGYPRVLGLLIGAHVWPKMSPYRQRARAVVDDLFALLRGHTVATRVIVRGNLGLHAAPSRKK